MNERYNETFRPKNNKKSKEKITIMDDRYYDSDQNNIIKPNKIFVKVEHDLCCNRITLIHI